MAHGGEHLLCLTATFTERPITRHSTDEPLGEARGRTYVCPHVLLSSRCLSLHKQAIYNDDLIVRNIVIQSTSSGSSYRETKRATSRWASFPLEIGPTLAGSSPDFMQQKGNYSSHSLGGSVCPSLSHSLCSKKVAAAWVALSLPPQAQPDPSLR